VWALLGLEDVGMKEERGIEEHSRTRGELRVAVCKEKRNAGDRAHEEAESLHLVRCKNEVHANKLQV
jgi:hypothetical protein